MFKKTKKIIALIMCLFMVLPLIAACGNAVWRGQSEGTVVVSSTEFNGIFSAPFARTAYDSQIAGLCNVSIYKYDRYAEPEAYACKYQKPKEFPRPADKAGIGGDTWVKYTFTLKDGINFSDGTPVTADDIIFTYKIYLDPTYDGASTLFNVPILGINEYMYDDPDYAAVKKQFEDEAEAKVNDPVWMLKWLVDQYSAAYGMSEDDLRPYINDGDEKAAAKDGVLQELKGNYIKEKLSSGTASVADIEGIKKINDKTVEVTITELSPTAEMDLAITIMPQHYYGVNFKKGDLSGVKALSDKPLGAGPYIFEAFENNVVSLIANPDYFESTPRLERLVYQVVDPGNEYDVLKNGDVDISDPRAAPAVVAEAKKDNLHFELIDNLGYGYIGVSAKMTPDKNVRKALMSLMNRGPAVESYYGELAVVIERPISMVSWAYPQGAKPYYEYSKDKALEFFKAAGYTQDGGKLVKDGQQYSVNLYISSDDHPVIPVFTQLKTDLESLGAKCEIVQLDWGAYSDKYSSGDLEVWAAAWGATPDPDMSQVYHSKSIATNNNPYQINNAELDKLIEDGIRTIDKNKRKEIYSKALDIVMEEAVEMPFYQRKNMYLMQQERVDITSLPENMTPYYEWDAEIYKLRTTMMAEAK